VLGRPLQPNPAGGPPTVPQALNRYAATPLGQPGVAEGTTSLPALGYALSIAKNAAAGALGYAVGEALGPDAYEIITVLRIGRLQLSATNRLLQGSGVLDLFTKVKGTGGRGKSAEYISGLVRETGEDVFKVAEGPNTGRIINLWEMRAQQSNRWLVKYGPEGPFEVTGYSSTVERVFLSTFWRDFGWNAGIAIAVETPFFVGNVLNDPYLTSQQKIYQGVITLGGIGTVAGVGAGVGAAFGAAYGNLPGAVAGFLAGLGYEYALVPLIIRPLIYQLRGVDPYDRTRRLAPLP
jgi:hypothetical protein